MNIHFVAEEEIDKKSSIMINNLTISMITAVGVLVINLYPIWTEPLTNASSSKKEKPKSQHLKTIKIKQWKNG